MAIGGCARRFRLKLDLAAVARAPPMASLDTPSTINVVASATMVTEATTLIDWTAGSMTDFLPAPLARQSRRTSLGLTSTAGGGHRPS